MSQAEYQPPVARATLSITPLSANLETTFDLQVRRRRQSCECGWQVTAEWVLDDVDTEKLRAFHRTRSGRYFQLKLPDHTGLKTQTVRFSGPLSVTPAGRGQSTLLAQLYWRDPVLMSDDELGEKLVESLGTWDDITFGEQLDTLMNTTLPDIYP